MPKKSRTPETPAPTVLRQPSAAPPMLGLDPLLTGNQAMLAQIAAQEQDPMAMGPIPPPVDSNLTRGLGGIPLAGDMLAEWSRDPQAYVEKNWKPDDSPLKKSDEDYQKITGTDPGTKMGSYTFKF